MKWIVAALLVWSQLASAAHQFEHAAADSDETCVVCVHLDRGDDALADTTHYESQNTKVDTLEPSAKGCNLPVKRVANYRSRASP